MLTFIIAIIFFIISIFLVYLLIKNDKGEKEPVIALWTAAAFGVGGVIIAVFIESVVFHSQPLNPGLGSIHLFSQAFLIGFIEEACKFLPLAIFIYKKRYFNEHTDGVIYFAIAGISFGLPENILYTISYGSSVGIGRLILTPLFHAALTGMVGYFLAKYKIEKKNLLKIIPYFLIAVLLHGLYDFGLSSQNNLYITISILITISLTLALYFLYIRATDLDRELGLSATGINNYCRNCGNINKAHHLYCTNCGNQT